MSTPATNPGNKRYWNCPTDCTAVSYSDTSKDKVTDTSSNARVESESEEDEDVTNQTNYEDQEEVDYVEYLDTIKRITDHFAH